MYVVQRSYNLLEDHSVGGRLLKYEYDDERKIEVHLYPRI
jgi:YD repeat-containing protein